MSPGNDGEREGRTLPLWPAPAVGKQRDGAEPLGRVRAWSPACPGLKSLSHTGVKRRQQQLGLAHDGSVLIKEICYSLLK